MSSDNVADLFVMNHCLSGCNITVNHLTVNGAETGNIRPTDSALEESDGQWLTVCVLHFKFLPLAIVIAA